jgi:CheY-like chemotaxis protein
MTGAKALLVDDRRENLVALEAILQGLPVETVAVTSGEEALKRLLLEDFAVILLDASMPNMDGFETATHIKQRERTRHIPIIFLTALNYDARLAFRGYQIGAVDFISKPFDPWVLRSKVAVFIDLWLKSAELTAQAVDRLALRDAVTKALSLLSTADQDGAVAVLRAAQARHADSRSR